MSLGVRHKQWCESRNRYLSRKVLISYCRTPILILALETCCSFTSSEKGFGTTPSFYHPTTGEPLNELESYVQTHKTKPH